MSVEAHVTICDNITYHTHTYFKLCLPKASKLKPSSILRSVCLWWLKKIVFFCAARKDFGAKIVMSTLVSLSDSILL